MVGAVRHGLGAGEFEACDFCGAAEAEGEPGADAGGDGEVVAGGLVEADGIISSSHAQGVFSQVDGVVGAIVELDPLIPVISAIAMVVVALISAWPAIRTVDRLDLATVVRERST